MLDITAKLLEKNLTIQRKLSWGGQANYDDNNNFIETWFPYFTPLMNVYLPICGSNCDSAMCVVPFP